MASSAGDEYLRIVSLLKFMFYEPECDNFDMESLRTNLDHAEFSITSALRVVATMHHAEQAQLIEQQIESYAESVMEIVAQLNVMPGIEVNYKISESPQDVSEILTELEGELELICERIKEKPRFYYGMDFTTNELKRAALYLFIEEENAYVFYVDANDQQLNDQVVDCLQENLTNAGLNLEIYYDSSKHAFMLDSVDIFLGVAAQLSIEMNTMSAPNIMRIMTYNCIPFTSMLAEDDDTGGNMPGMGGMTGSGTQDENGVLDGMDGEDFDDYGDLGDDIDDYDGMDDFDDVDDLPGD